MQLTNLDDTLIAARCNGVSPLIFRLMVLTWAEEGVGGGGVGLSGRRRGRELLAQGDSGTLSVHTRYMCMKFLSQ